MADQHTLGTWVEIQREEVNSWNVRLLETDASYRQYPYWNEPYRKQFATPQYLVYGSAQNPEAYVCIVSLGIGRLRIGLVQYGPVFLTREVNARIDLVGSLIEWATKKGFIFLRFTNSDEKLIESIAALPSAVKVDAFPLYHPNRNHLLVKQVEDDGEMLASFQKVCRYEIRTATRVGYEICVSDSSEELARAWRIFTATARQKGFRLSSRPLSGWTDVLRRARPYQLARLYSAHLNGQCVQAIFVIRYGDTAEYMIGALNLESIQGHPSPSCLLHWHAMRDFYRQGCR